ncbi:MAG: hypothetical protein GY804_10655 [Alphaproteobacteria bacterium]|nr:hypothetical protein [Alphaproteobacteria bacterium]
MRILLLICFFLISGCLSSEGMPSTKTTQVSQQTISDINRTWHNQNRLNETLTNEQKSVIVFMRPFKAGAAVPAAIFEIANRYPQVISFLEAKAKFAHNTTPGKHIFMVASANGTDFVEINAQAGKLYYVLLNMEKAKYGSQFNFIPLELDKTNLNDAARLQNWSSTTRWSANKKISNKDLNPKSMESIYSRYDTMFDAWQANENRKILNKAYGSSAPKIPHSKPIDTGTD